jgi:hypothetical protein
MKHSLRLLPLFLVFGALVSLQESARADGNQMDDQGQQYQRPTTRQNDSRLPPVIPGEQIVTESGQRMNVWSSAGPVPVNPTQPPQQYYGGYGYGPGVIVDGRNNPNFPPPPNGGPAQRIPHFGGR